LPAALAFLPAQASEARPAAQALGCATARKRLTNEAANLSNGNGVTDDLCLRRCRIELVRDF